MKHKFLAVILAGGMLLTITGCGQETMEVPQDILVQEDEEEAYPTTTVEYGEVVKNITVRCNYTSTDKQELSFHKDGGLIERVEVKMGDYVDAGQLLVALDVEDLEAQIEELEYQVKSQELKLQQTLEMKQFELDSAERMFGYTYQTKQDEEDLKDRKESIEDQYKTTIEDLTDQLSVQKQRLAQYRKELDEGRLFADITGEITYVENGLEDTYTVKDRVVVTVSNLDACYFATEDREYAEYFTEGESVNLTYRVGGADYNCEVVPALMDQWGNQLYFETVNGDIIDSETRGTIVKEIDRRSNVLCIPVDALNQSDKGPFVYLEKDGLLEMRYVTVGLEGDSLVEITEGLEQGEIVALKK